MEQEIAIGTLYDINKSIMQNEKPINKPKLTKKQEELEEWFNWVIDGYAMLLCRERYDFTIFHLYEKANPNPCAVAAKELIEILQNRGRIITINKVEDGTINVADGAPVWEIWMLIDGEAFAYYLFRCDDFVIEC